VIRAIYGIRGAVAVMAAAFSLPASAQPDDPGHQPYPPFKIAENLYYVGASDYASYLIATKAGMILIDGGDAVTGAQVLKNIRTLGFDPAQVKVLLNSHGHFDHAGGLAQIKRETGARLLVSAADGALIARGGRGDMLFGDRYPYEPVKPDGVLTDGQKVTLGGTTLTAHLTPGHTRGCTTWTFPVTVSEGPRMNTRQALVHCSNSVLPGYRLVGQETYPGQRADYEKSYRFWRSAKCEVFLASHASFFRMKEKRAAVVMDGNPFVDPAGCKAFFDKGYAAFQAELARQQAAAR
jgi:metallo-beta-lactamase class B